MSEKRSPGRGSQLTPSDRMEIQRLHFVDRLNISAIARQTGRDRGTIATVLQAEDSKAFADQLQGAQAESAIATLTKATNTVAADWVRASAKAADKGDHRPAKDLLLHTGVIEPVEGHRANVGIQIVLNGGDPPRELSLAKVDAKSEGDRTGQVIEVSPITAVISGLPAAISERPTAVEDTAHPANGAASEAASTTTGGDGWVRRDERRNIHPGPASAIGTENFSPEKGRFADRREQLEPQDA